MKAAILGGDFQTVEQLLVKGDDQGSGPQEVNRCLTGETGLAALHIACLAGKLEVTKVLLEHNADLSLMDAKMRSPLHCAVEGGNLSVTQCVLEKLSEKDWAGKMALFRDRRELTPLHLACGNPSLFATIAQYVPRERVSEKEIVHRCVSCEGGFECIKLMLPLTDQSAVEELADTKTSLMIKATELGCIETVQLLMELGADVHVCDEDEQNALHWACMLGHQDIVEFLLARDASGQLAAKVDCHGKSPMDYLEPTCVATNESVEGNASSIATPEVVEPSNPDIDVAAPPMAPTASAKKLPIACANVMESPPQTEFKSESVLWKDDREELDMMLAASAKEMELLSNSLAINAE